MLKQVTWHIGSMAEGDTRSTIRIARDVVGDRAQYFASGLYMLNLVMEVSIWSDVILVKLDIGDLHSKVMPWSERRPPINQAELNQILQQVDTEAEKVAFAAHQLLVETIPGIDPIPVFEHDWTPRSFDPSELKPMHAY